ncbi:MAG TPA: hypothetical protein VHX64_17670 [Caulobacteraceae bacterium]|jgi:hypothetical protein|nr:hypothetical protein [Caulobacteraceae bacterium]
MSAKRYAAVLAAIFSIAFVGAFIHALQQHALFAMEGFTWRSVQLAAASWVWTGALFSAAALGFKAARQ